MTKYTRKELDAEARRAVRVIAKKTKQPAKLVHWQLLIDGLNPTLQVIVQAFDGLRYYNIAI